MDRVKLGNRIKTERVKYNISQKELAKMIGVDPTVYSRMERGERELSIENLTDISHALHVKTDYFLFDSYEDETEKSFTWLLEQTYKLNKEQHRLLLKIVKTLMENSDRWMVPDKSNLAVNKQPENDKNVNYNEIGNRIRAERLKQKLTQEKLSELAGLSENFLGNIERAATIPSIESLFKIANALELPISRFFINASKNNKAIGLYDAVEGLLQSDSDKSVILLSILTVLIDNFDKW